MFMAQDATRKKHGADLKHSELHEALALQAWGEVLGLL